MSTLYIGNATRQIHQFLYRVPESEKLRSQNIQPGTQIRIPGEVDKASIDYIVDQHSRFGMIPAAEIPKTKEFNGLCYSVDKPILADKIVYLMDHNVGKLEEMGREIREQTALAGNAVLETTLRENDRPEQIREFQMTIQEDRTTPNPEVAQMSEGFKVSRNGSDNDPSQGRQNGRRRAA